MGFFDRFRAERMNGLARAAEADGRLSDAEALYRQATEVAPRWSLPWYNLGLAYKRSRRWEDSLSCNRQAVLLDESDEAANWNLGIAATAVGDWRTAREAWQRCGMRFPDQEGLVDLKLGLIPIRISTDDEPEVVWCHRLDPARAKITSVPLPKSGRRHLDVLLIDGEPKGQRMLNGHPVPVLEELGVLERSTFITFTADVTLAPSDDEDSLAEMLYESGIIAEDWTANLRHLCKACSEGLPSAEHNHASDDGKESRHFGIAARDEGELRAALDTWRAAASERVLAAVERAL